MRVTFRQGILKYPHDGVAQSFLDRISNYVSLIGTGDGYISLCFAQGTANYHFTEHVDIEAAWHDLPSSGAWLYWDLNKITGVRTFGYTEIAPLYSSGVPPPSPATDQHWFDLSRSRLFVWSGTVWTEHIRVFAAYTLSGSILTRPVVYTPPSGFGLMEPSGIGNMEFAGTQVNLGSGQYNAGRIITTDLNYPVRLRSNEFLTTETVFVVQGSPLTTIKLESEYTEALADDIITTGSVVKFNSDGTIIPAQYNDINTTVVGFVTYDTQAGDIAQVILQGTIRNATWDWSTPGQALWPGDDGLLTTEDLGATQYPTHPSQKPPIARVIDANTIIFQQGLGGQGERGREGDLFSTYRGHWDQGQPYVVGQTVTYNGSLYIALINNLNSIPLIDGSNPDWKMMVQKGADGLGFNTLDVFDESLIITDSPTSINFVGSGVTATAVGGDITITVPGQGAEGAFTDIVDTLRTDVSLIGSDQIALGQDILGDGGDYIYYWNSSSTASDDDFDVIKPNSFGGGTPGRWFRLESIKLNRVNTYSAQQVTAQTTIAAASTVTINLNLNQTPKILLTQSVGTLNLTNMLAGGTYVISLLQDGTGGRTIGFGTMFKFPSDIDPVPDTAANSLTLIFCYSDGTYIYASDSQPYSTT